LVVAAALKGDTLRFPDVLIASLDVFATALTLADVLLLFYPR